MLVLTLSIISYQKKSLGSDAEITLRQQGCSFGRAPDNDWSLPDPERYISGKHGAVAFREGRYWLTDSSTNGIYINKSAAPLGRNNSIELNSGDILNFGDYEVDVSIRSAAKNGEDPFLTPAVSEPSNPSEEVDEVIAASNYREELSDSGLSDDLSDDWLSNKGSLGGGFPGGGVSDQALADPFQRKESGVGLFPWEEPERDDDREPMHSQASASLNSGDILSEVFVAPKVAVDESAPVAQLRPPVNEYAKESKIPDDWDQTGYGNFALMQPDSAVKQAPQKPAFVDAPVERPQAPQPLEEVSYQPPLQDFGATSQGDAFASFIKGMGMDINLFKQQDQARLMENFGYTFREMLQGILDLLRVRTELKNEFRMHQTTIQACDNNSLKFSLSVDMAVRNLFAEPSPGNLDAIESISEAVNDVRTHQVALMTGMEMAFNSLMKQLKPENFSQDNTKPNAKGNKLPVFGGKSKAWDNYCQFYERTVIESEDPFRRLFAERFADAYQDMVNQLDK